MKTSSKGLEPVYLIYGEQELLLERALERLKKRASQEGDLGFSYEVFWAGEANVGEIINSLNTLSFSFGKKVAVIKEANKFNASELKEIEKYVKNPSHFTTLVLVAEKLKVNSPLLKAVKGGAVVSEYKAPRKNEYPLWVKEEFQRKGKKVSLSAVQFMVQSLGFNLSILTREIEKICLYYYDKNSLEKEDLDFLLSAGEESSVFDLVDAIGEKNSTKAIALLDKLSFNRDSLMFCFNMIIRHFRLLLKTKVLLEEGRTYDLPKELNLPSFVVQRYQVQSRNFSIKQLKKIHEELLEADLALKTSKKEPKLILELLITKALID